MSPSMDDPLSNKSTNKTAIKGFSLASKVSSKPLPKPSTSSSLGKRPRATFHADDGSDSENEYRGGGRGKHESVTGFGEGGAIRKGDEERRKREEESLLVIPKMSNRDWKSEARQRRGGSKNLLPPEVQRQRDMAAKQRDGGSKAEGVDVVNSKDGEIQWGLTVRNREVAPAVKEESEAGPDVKMEEQVEIIKQEPPQTADEEALAALLGEKKENKAPDLVIPAASNDEREKPAFTEEDAYKRAVALAPDVSTLEDYERVPVEEFGAALLRGMGWKGKKEGQIKEVKRRQNLLGLGAKELKDAEELGAWVQKSDVKRLNERKGPSGGDRRPRVSEYKREKERRDERRDERGGGGYRRERERERDSGSYRHRDGDRHRDRR